MRFLLKTNITPSPVFIKWLAWKWVVEITNHWRIHDFLTGTLYLVFFGQVSPKTAWKWRKLERKRGTSEILLCRSATANETFGSTHKFCQNKARRANQATIRSLRTVKKSESESESESVLNLKISKISLILSVSYIKAYICLINKLIWREMTEE